MLCYLMPAVQNCELFQRSLPKAALCLLDRQHQPFTYRKVTAQQFLFFTKSLLFSKQLCLFLGGCCSYAVKLVVNTYCINKCDKKGCSLLHLSILGEELFVQCFKPKNPIKVDGLVEQGHGSPGTTKHHHPIKTNKNKHHITHHPYCVGKKHLFN